MNKIFTLALSVLSVLGARAINMPPYDVYPYVADETDDPPVNYMKVVDPGSVGEENASYVVLGFSYPRACPAVSQSYVGDLVIPSHIDGLPVRKIDEAAFLLCTKLTSVRVPYTVREIGERAFSDCYSLTNITFESGVSVIGDGAFTNCVALTELRFPKTLSRLGLHCFQGCLELTDVYFEGNAPRIAAAGASDKSVLGERIFRQYGYYERFRVHIQRDTYGWLAPNAKGVPERWPVDYGFLSAHEVVSEGAPAGLMTVIATH